MRNQLTANDANALHHLRDVSTKATVALECAIVRKQFEGQQDIEKLRNIADSAYRDYINFLNSLTETPQSAALEQERLDTKNMVIRGCRLAIVPLLDESPIHASERSHLCLTLGMALGYLTRSDVP